jgi:two-component system, OmpR family, response regulator
MLMTNRAPLVTDEDFYALTTRGEAEIQAAKTNLPALALELLVRMDGTTSVAQLRAGMAATPFDDIAQTLRMLLRDKYVCYATASLSDAIDFRHMTGFARPRPAGRDEASTASCAAEAGLKSLEHYGYYVRIARRPAAKPSLPTNRQPRVVVIEDELHLAKFLKHFLMFEGFDVRVAGDRATIAQVLAEAPAPDLVLLDVMLPDTNGFDVLRQIREHATLHAVPVMMLTAETTRQAVITGLAGGADGYITKPFQTDILINAIKTMFGLTHSRVCPWTYV